MKEFVALFSILLGLVAFGFGSIVLSVRFLEGVPFGVSTVIFGGISFSLGIALLILGRRLSTPDISVKTSWFDGALWAAFVSLMTFGLGYGKLELTRSQQDIFFPVFFVSLVLLFPVFTLVLKRLLKIAA